MWSSWSAVVLVLASVGCGEKTVQLDLQLPPAALASQFNTSCVLGVEVYLNGANYLADGKDFVYDCIDLQTPAPTFADVRRQLQGTIDVGLPASGLTGVELYGFAGSCGSSRVRDFDLLFYGSGAYIGGDTVAIQMTPNLNCAPIDVTIKPIDLLKLVKGGCAAATWTEGKLALATLSPFPFFDGETYWWGGTAAGTVTNGVVNVRGNVEVGPSSCLSVGLYTDAWYGVTCVPPAEQRVCATGNQYEAPMINLAVWRASQDGMLITQWGGLIVGAVYGTAGPVANATVTLDAADADHGEVVYFDMPPGVENGTGALTPRAGTTTGPSGLFGIYTMGFVRATITANGQTVKRTFGGNEDSMSAVVVKM